MEKRRKFLNELYLNRIEKIPFIDYFQNNSYLRKSLFNMINLQHNFDSDPFYEIKTFKILREIYNEVEDFEKMALQPTILNNEKVAKIFIENTINKLENIGIPKFTKLFLFDFKENQENKNIIVNYVVDNFMHMKSEISIEQARKNYRELKRIVDVIITNYLKEQSKQEKHIFSKFTAIGFLDYRDVDQHLLTIDSITKKLDYLKTIKKNYYDKYLSAEAELNEDERLFYTKNHPMFFESIFGSYSLRTPLSIQSPVFFKHFPQGLKNPEFTYWFLKFNAQEVFKHTVASVEFKNKLNSNLREINIKAELKELADQEEKAIELLINKELNINAYHKNNNKYSTEVELLRILDGNYYQDNTISSISSWGIEVQIYAKHLILKPYLERLLLDHSSNNIEGKKKMISDLTVFERINRELNIVAWAYECQFMEKTKDMSYPMLHSDGRFLFNTYSITSNIEMIRLQEYIRHYTERFESTNNTTLVLNEIAAIHEKVKNLIDFYNTKLTHSGELCNLFIKNMPTDYREKSEYKSKHTAIIVTEDLYPRDIVFGIDSNSREAEWTRKEYSYLTSNDELLLFCQKLLDFTKKFSLEEQFTTVQKSDVDIKPIFKPEIIDEVFDLLKDYFELSEQPILKTIMQTGNNASEKLYFMDNGNRLADAFKQLISVDFITGCQKKDLQKWIFQNFKFKKDRVPCDFKLRYLEDVISTNREFCKKSIFEIRKKDNVLKIEKI